MRLTLRTLLGWVDGILPFEEQRLIGQMVAGSKVATRVAGRIREGAACGSIDVPLAGGPAIADDPNRVAEYLDNTLLSEHLEAFERFCIESRPHLAEVATCHRILAEMSRTPKLARMPRAQRSILGQRIRGSLSTSAVGSSVACAERSEEVPRKAVAAEKPAAASDGHTDARAAADALVQAMLSKPSRPSEPFRSKEPVHRDVGWQDPVALAVSFLPSWRRSAEPAASELAVNGSAAVALAPEPAVSQFAAAAPGPFVGPATVGAAAGSKPTPLAAWVTAALALAVLLAAGGALTSPLRGPKTYKPEPGCMHCTKP